MLSNFNQITKDGLKFPTLNITEADLASHNATPSVEDPGWIVEDTNGKWQWFSKIDDCYHKQSLGILEDLAVYAAFQVSDVFCQYARQAHFNKDGSESFGGKVQFGKN